MKNIWFLILSVILPIGVFAGDSYKNWEDGELKWDDFQGVHVPGKKSLLVTGLDTKLKQEHVNGKIKISMKATAEMDKSRSYADSTIRNEQLLRYHQLQFDLLEVYRRRLQNDLNSKMTSADIKERVKHYRSQYAQQVELIAKQTDNGMNDHKLQEWEYFVRKDLEELGLPPVPEIVPNKFSSGAYIGTGGIFPLGNIDSAFSGSWTFVFGLQFGYDRLKLKSDLTFGQSQLENVNIFNKADQENFGSYSNYLGISVSLGYTVLNTSYFSITPHFGGYWSSYSWNVANIEWIADGNGGQKKRIKDTESVDVSNFNWYACIDFDYNFHRFVTTHSRIFPGKREQYTSTLRISPFIARARYNKTNPSLAGYQIGFTIAYVGIGRTLGIK